MKKFFLLLLAPLLMSTQCEKDSDPVFRTEYFIQNDSGIDVILITEAAGEIRIGSQSSQFIAVATDRDGFVLPSESIAFDSITLYREGDGGDLVIAYEQQPIEDALWRLDQESEYDVAYVLVLTEALLE